LTLLFCGRSSNIPRYLPRTTRAASLLAARTLGIQLHILHASTDRELETVFARLNVSGLVVIGDPRSFHSPPCGGAPRVPVYARRGGGDRSRMLALLFGEGRPLAHTIRTTVQKNQLPGGRL